MTTSSVSEGRAADRQVSPPTRPHSEHALVELIDRILDKGLVIDAWASVAVLGIELITIEARIVVASLETYLRYAEAITAVPLVSRPPAQPTRVAQAPAGQQPLPQPQAAPASQQQAQQAPQQTSPQGR
jgi:hypothetical protein